MTDTNISPETLAYINKMAEREMVAEKKAEEDQKRKTEFTEKFNDFVSDKKYENIKGMIQETAKEKDYSKFGVEGVGLLMETVNIKMERERINDEAKKKLDSVDEGASVDRSVSPSSAGETVDSNGIPMASQNVIDFTKLSDEAIDPKIKRTADRIRNIQQNKARQSSWKTGEF